MDDVVKEKLVVILGAGASRGCLGNGIAGHANNQWLPPLAKELFDQRFDPLLRGFIRLAAHLDDVRTVLSSEDSNFEKCLQDFYRSAERSGDRWPLDIPLYLRELLWTVSDEYLEGSSKYDTLVQRALGSSFEKVMFLNLNYDLFVERHCGTAIGICSIVSVRIFQPTRSGCLSNRTAP